jgi:hypothetical protein
MKKLTTFVIVTFICQSLYAQSWLTTKPAVNSIPLADTIYVDEHEDWLVNKVSSLLQSDIQMVTGKKPVIIHSLAHPPKNLIIIGTSKQTTLSGKWEAFRIQTVSKPFPGVDNALVLTGSDKRGTAYATFELSKQLGVSPWYWWADVPVKKKAAVFIKKGTYDYPSPSVKYRGIFINDEAPAFSGWTKEKFGGVNHLVYEKVFELLLRLRGNYLWPAMWGNAFNTDDTLNPVLADKWGIVMGTSHHEPMLRAQAEWKHTGKGEWNYTTNDTVLRAFWRKGIENMGTHESIVTVGMRGDGDMPMTEGTATALLERIVKDQRQIIEDVTHKPASYTPQMWALYKEVQDYYDKGMRVPDDVTLLLCDDNWGNIRKLPKLNEAPRSGGYGIYYHFDYVGDPRNYKWINTNNIARVWEQMHLAKTYGADKVWIVNVGDIKPMEFPISFFLDYAWDTNKWNEDNLRTYYTQWASDQFGPLHAKEIGELLRLYGQYAARKKPELLNYATKELVEQWSALLLKAESIQLPAEYKDAYFQLVLHPIKAFTILHQLYYAVEQNKNPTAFYIQDSLLSLQYNKELAGGKWNHMMDQVHIGYTYWQQPDANSMPTTVTKPLPDNAVSILATSYLKAISSSGIRWKTIPDIGKDGDGVTTFPVTASVPVLTANSPHLQYIIKDTGVVKITACFSPTLNFPNEDGLKYAISVDDEKPQIIVLNKDDNNKEVWSKWVADNIIEKTSYHSVSGPGKHVINYWMISPAVILQKFKIETNL